MTGNSKNLEDKYKTRLRLFLEGMHFLVFCTAIYFVVDLILTYGDIDTVMHQQVFVLRQIRTILIAILFQIIAIYLKGL